MREEAVLLIDRGLSPENANLAKVLRFFGVHWRAVTVAEFLSYNNSDGEGRSTYRLFCSSEIFLRLIEDLEHRSDGGRFWREHVLSTFVYGGDDSAALQKLIRRLTGDEGAVLNEINGCAGEFVVSGELDDFCGGMAGLRVAASKADLDASLILNTPKGNTINIISLGYGATFLKLEYKGVAVFLSTFRKIIDIDAELTSQNFDVRDHFLSAVPLVLYVKWAFAETCWSAPETNACLMIDDPVLKSTHGFVNFQELLSLMKRHKFSTNIAFIPWNWRRSAPEVIQLFKENPENYSVSVHGCDHTRAEFGGLDWQRLYWKAQQALERMNRHESITGIRHDRVHDYCSDHCARLVSFIERLNALKYRLEWRSLTEVVRRSYRQREISPDVVEVEMYGRELRVRNRFAQAKRFLVRRRECKPSAVREVRDGSGRIAWNSVEGCIDFEIELNAGENRMIHITFHELAGNGRNGDNLPYRFKTMLRRYLCEVRDNYIMTTKTRLADFVSR